MYQRAIADDLEMVSFLWRAVPQARIPYERNDDGATINQINF